MAEAVVSVVLGQLVEIARKQIGDEVSLVRGVEQEVSHISSELTTIQKVLHDAEKKQYKDETIKHWLNKLENVSCDIGDVLDEWNYALLKLQIESSKSKVRASILYSCLCFEKVATRHDIAIKIKGLKDTLDMILKDKNKYDFIVAEPRVQSVRIKSTSFVDVSEIQGRDVDRDALLSNLILECEPCPHVISLMGAGGIGKTTLAQLVFNHDQVKKCFEKRIWVCVSDEVKIAQAIVEQVTKKASELNDPQALLNHLADLLSGQKFLLVLDDVWEEYSSSDKWERALKSCLESCGGLGSKILVTTRSEVVAKQMGSTTKKDIHRLGLLSHKECWSLMSRTAFLDRSDEEREKLKHIGMEIANKCKGLPLVAKILGSPLRFKDNTIDWEKVLNDEIWQLEKAKDDLSPHLLLSYNELTPEMKLCFSYCAVFPKDHEIDIEKLIRMWMAQGYLSSRGNTCDLELRGKEYFNILKVRSFFQDFGEFPNGRSLCKMHDIVHDFAQFLRKNTSHNNVVDPNGRAGTTTKASSQACDPLLVSHFSKYRSFLICEKDVSDFTHLFKSDLRLLRVLECKENIPTDLENLTQLRYLAIQGSYNNDSRRSELSNIPQTIFKLYNLETLDLGHLGILEIPKEIGNLIKLRHLDLYQNYDIEELPESIYNLGELRTLNVQSCTSLKRIPKGIEKLVNLKHFMNTGNNVEQELPEGLRQLTRLETLDEFRAGRGGSKLGYLKELNKLSGLLTLLVKLDDDDTEEDRMMMIEEAKKAQLRNKIHLQKLYIEFDDNIRMEREDEAEESMRNDIMEALQPPPNLSFLSIDFYKGKKFPGWMMSPLSPLYHLKALTIFYCNNCTVWPPLGKLPYLEQLKIFGMESLELVGREFLGITSSEEDNNNKNDSQVAASSSSSSTNSHVVVEVVTLFPKLKELSISFCKNWVEWEDITTTAEEEEDVLSIMPCLEYLEIDSCSELKELPLRLLRKASSSLE